MGCLGAGQEDADVSLGCSCLSSAPASVTARVRDGFVSSTEAEPLPREEGSWMGMPVPLSADSPEFPCESFPTPSSKGDFFPP